MGVLDPQSDRVVQAAVDAYLAGRLHPAIESSVAFETQNSRYGITDGAISYASAEGLIGTQLVGWLIGSADRAVVSAWWREKARAVLIDLRRGRHVIVTSPTRAYRSLTKAAATLPSRPPGSALPAPQPRATPGQAAEHPFSHVSFSSPPEPADAATTTSELPAAEEPHPVIPLAPRPARFPPPGNR